MRLSQRFARLTIWNKIGVIGALASIAALALWVFGRMSPPREPSATQEIPRQQTQGDFSPNIQASGPVAFSVNRPDESNDVAFSPMEMERITNRKFGFYTKCPKAWDTLIAEVGDGFSIHDPRHPDVKLTIYGTFLWREFMLPDNRPSKDFSEKTAYDVVQYRKAAWDSIGNIISETPSGIRVDDHRGRVTSSAFGDKIFTIHGRRIEYINPAGTITFLQKVGVYEGVVYTVLCEAPSELFDQYRSLFEQMIGDFKVLTTSLEKDGKELDN